MSAVEQTQEACPITMKSNENNSCCHNGSNFPLFCDLGKNSRDLFSNMYNPDELKITASSKASESLVIFLR